jgi:P-type conjugative transfer protein TrbJ
MIEYWKKNLMNLNFTSLDEVAATMGKLQTIVDQSLGLGYKLEGMGTEFTTLYGEFGGEAVSSEVYHKQYKAWLKQTRDGVQNAFEAQGIVMTNPDHKAAIENLIKQSQSAEGTLQALQAANQISGVIISQLNELKTLTAANGQALSSYLGYKAAVDDHGRAWSENFFKPVKINKDIPTPDLYPFE